MPTIYDAATDASAAWRIREAHLLGLPVLVDETTGEPLKPADLVLSPADTAAAGGATITVTGTAVYGATKVTVDGSSVTFAQDATSAISFTAPAHTAAAVAVVVTTPGGTATTNLTYA